MKGGELSTASVQELKPSLTDPARIEGLTAMDDPDNMSLLHELGTLAAARQVRPEDFASNFDLPPS